MYEDKRQKKREARGVTACALPTLHKVKCE
jgi:hypothetical protein